MRTVTIPCSIIVANPNLVATQTGTIVLSEVSSCTIKSIYFVVRSYNDNTNAIGAKNQVDCAISGITDGACDAVTGSMINSLPTGIVLTQNSIVDGLSLVQTANNPLTISFHIRLEIVSVDDYIADGSLIINFEEN